MAENETTPSAAEGEAPQRHFEIVKLYVKDISFESPNSPAAFQEQSQPKVDFSMETAQSLAGEDLWEVSLKVHVETKTENNTLFLCEVTQSGLFGIRGFSDQELDQMLGTFCAGTLFPYAREVVSDLVIKGGFQPLILAPVNFDALYQQKLQQAKQAEQAEQAEQTH